MTYLLKEKRAKGSSTLKHKKGKRQPAREKRKKNHSLKRKNAYSRQEVIVAEGKGGEVDG